MCLLYFPIAFKSFYPSQVCKVRRFLSHAASPGAESPWELVIHAAAFNVVGGVAPGAVAVVNVLVVVLGQSRLEERGGEQKQEQMKVHDAFVAFAVVWLFWESLEYLYRKYFHHFNFDRFMQIYVS